MSPSVHTTHMALLKFVETLPACPHGCPWQDVHGTPTFSGITPIKEQYQAWADEARKNGPDRLQEHLVSTHPANSPQLKLHDRVRVTFEATVDIIEPGRVTVVMPGSGTAKYFCAVPPGATVEVLPPPTLAERMTMLATELGQPAGPGDYWAGRSEAAERIREALAADEAAAKNDSERRVCGSIYSHNAFSPLVSCQLPAGHDGYCDWAHRMGVTQ